ncbi:MAG: hypothetical protein EOO47_00070 [Flavobacterium sp.]|nr:MAG: hypothetical protein EOO47_00070 [Flavobacterium sp.]
MAKFTKGTPKPPTSGRKKGVKNKTTEQIREQIKNVVSNKLDVFEADLQTMSPFQQWMILEKVTKYFLPALNKNDDSVTHSGNISINISFEDNETEGGVIE